MFGTQSLRIQSRSNEYDETFWNLFCFQNRLSDTMAEASSFLSITSL